jgi:SAM-dependent methyltransferase
VSSFPDLVFVSHTRGEISAPGSVRQRKPAHPPLAPVARAEPPIDSSPLPAAALIHNYGRGLLLQSGTSTNSHPLPPQVNAGATCLLYHLAGSWAAATPSTLLLDVCCGTGTIGISLAASAKAVVGIDNVESAVEDAKANAALNGVGNASWVCGAAEKVFGRLLRVRSRGGARRCELGVPVHGAWLF